MLATLLMPFGIAVLYNELYRFNNLFYFYYLLASTIWSWSMGSGYMVSIMMAEDKETNLKSLILSGVTATEYTSVCLFPILIMLLKL